MFLEMFGQGVPPLGCVPHPESLGGVGIEASLGEEVAARLRLRTGQLLLIKSCGTFMRFHQALALSLLLIRSYPTVDILQGDSNFVGEFLDRLGKGQVVNLLNETNEVTTFTTTEAVPHAAAGSDMETG